MLGIFFNLYVAGAASILALLLHSIGWKRKTLSANLDLLLPNPPPFFYLRFYFHLSQDLLRFLHRHYGRPIKVRKKDEQKLKILKSSPSLLLPSHFHNWELMGAWFQKNGLNLLSAARSLHSPGWQKQLSRLRAKLGLRTIFVDIPAQAKQHLNSGGCFGMLWDQFSPHSQYEVPLLNSPALMNPLPFFLRSHLPVPVFFAALLPGGQLRICRLMNEGKFLTDSRLLGRRYHKILGKLILSHPTFWYGFCHARFKNLGIYPPRP